jgi:ribonucleoside-diphosphate reductase alpha chain
LLSDNAKKIFETLYSKEKETIDDTFSRVAKEFAVTEVQEKLAFDLQKNNMWRPNTPTYFNAGKKDKDKIFSACYVVSLEDSMDSIYDIANVARKIFQFGSGIGIPIGNLREKEAYIYEGEPEQPPEGKSSGPIVFMKLYDSVGETTRSGGRVRRAAILCSMRIDHPDIEDFIVCKDIDGTLSNMNISVNITDKFIKSLEDKISFELVSVSNGETVKTIDSQKLWELLVDCAWKTADPGVLFIDNINKFNVLKSIKLIETPNPCGEQPLLPFMACNLSAINVSKFVVGNEIFDFDGLEKISGKILELMDNIIDVMAFPDKRFKDNVVRYRPVGIGPMGLSDAMFKLRIKYDSSEGKKFAGEIMKAITKGCVRKSALLAKEKGKFYNYDLVRHDVEDIISQHVDDDEEIMSLVKMYGLRNCQFTTAQPTGTTALSCDCSYGIEPCFGLVFQKNLVDGSTMHMVNPVFQKEFENESWYTNDLLDKIAKNGGSLKNIRGIPKEIRDIFIVAHDIKPKDRIDVQSELQKYCSTAISSTVNLPSSTTKEEISDLFKYAYEKNLKGITIYRDGSKKNQPVTFKKDEIVKEFVRPTRLLSETIKIETGNGKLYATIGQHEGKLVEVILQLGKGGKDMYAMSEALGRSISVGLQHGAPIQAYIKQFRSINSDKPTWTRLEEEDKRPVQVLSVPDGLAKLLERYYSNGGDNLAISKVECISEEILCPKCKINYLKEIEGCLSCPACGYSKCS